MIRGEGSEGKAFKVVAADQGCLRRDTCTSQSRNAFQRLVARKPLSLHVELRLGEGRLVQLRHACVRLLHLPAQKAGGHARRRHTLKCHTPRQMAETQAHTQEAHTRGRSEGLGHVSVSGGSSTPDLYGAQQAMARQRARRQERSRDAAGGTLRRALQRYNPLPQPHCVPQPHHVPCVAGVKSGGREETTLEAVRADISRSMQRRAAAIRCARTSGDQGSGA